MKTSKQIKPKGRYVKVKKSDLLMKKVIDDDDEDEDEEDAVFDMIRVSKKTKRMLSVVQDDWVKSYLIN